MFRRIAVVALALGLSFGLFGRPAFAVIGAHVEAAIEHTKEAIEDGATGATDDIVVHVMSALGHAREALHVEALEADRAANKLLHRAIRLLRKAEMHGRFGHADKAVKHAKEALAVLEKVK